MAAILFGLVLMGVGVAGIQSGFQSRNDNAGIFIAIGIVIELGGIALFFAGIKEYYIKEIIVELKKLNGEVIPKSTDGFTFGPDKKPK